MEEMREILNLIERSSSLVNFLHLINESFSGVTFEFSDAPNLTKKQKAFFYDILWMQRKASVENVLTYYASYMQALCKNEFFFENSKFFIDNFKQCAIRVYFLSMKIKKHENLFSQELLHSFNLKTKNFRRNEVILVFLILGSDQIIKKTINDLKNEILSQEFLESDDAYQDLYFLLVRKKLEENYCSTIFEAILSLDGSGVFNKAEYLKLIKKLQKKLPDINTLNDIKKQAVRNYMHTQKGSNGHSEPEKWLYDTANQVGLGQELNEFNIKNSQEKKCDFADIKTSVIVPGNTVTDCEETFEKTISRIIQISTMKSPDSLGDLLLNSGCIIAHSHSPTGETSPVHDLPYDSCFQDVKIQQLIKNQALR